MENMATQSDSKPLSEFGNFKHSMRPPGMINKETRGSVKKSQVSYIAEDIIEY
jgi:hypothetical protein